MQNFIDLNEIAALRAATQQLTVGQLETARDWVRGVIEDRAQSHRQKLEERNLKQMRGLMTKAGISWEEFQDALK